MNFAKQAENTEENADQRAATERLHGVLEPAEQMVGFVYLDLDQRRHFAETLLALTGGRLIEQPAGKAYRSWNISSDLALRSNVFSGLGKLVLVRGSTSMATWYFTAAKANKVSQLMAQFNAAARDQQSSEPSPAVEVALTPAAAPAPTKSLLRLARFTKHRLKLVLLGMLLTLLATAAGLIWPYLTMPLIDNVLIPWQSQLSPLTANQFYVALMPYIVGLIAAALLAWGLGWARTYSIGNLSEQISCDLRNATYRHLQKLSLDYYGDKRTGDLISRISSDTDRICLFLSSHLLDFATDLLMILLTSIILIQLDPWLALVALLPFPLIAWLTHGVRVRLRHGFARAGHAWEAMVSVLTDAIPGVRVVKAFAQEQREGQRFQDANQHVLDSNVRINRLWAFFGPTVTLLTEVGMLLIWLYGAWLVAHQSITVGKLTLFITYIGRFYIRLDSMSRMLADTQRAAAATYRVFEILDQQPSVMEPQRPVDLGRVRGRIEFRNLRFRYGNREVLSGIDMEIQPGELIGLVGPSGSGKSTLVNLVCRFYDVTEGSILVDGHDIRSFSIEKFRSHIGIVLQEPYLFFGTIAENIAYGRPQASPAQIIAAARAAHAHVFISRLPDGYDSMVGERGQGLSGGERQRISIARAILTDPRILILDEATSAVDNETEREIQAALDNLIQGRTTIAIAHRLSTLRNADRIVVMEHGVVAEIGKHDELLTRGGVYTRLHQAQMNVMH
ncbi:MAG: ABC transporter ATP-binding protein [Pirellulaceae bacterium]|nr:ABC transporter ATP-binding protein [Pirellulaceae bacterium]